MPATQTTASGIPGCEIPVRAWPHAGLQLRATRKCAIAKGLPEDYFKGSVLAFVTTAEAIDRGGSASGGSGDPWTLLNEGKIMWSEKQPSEWSSTANGARSSHPHHRRPRHEREHEEERPSARAPRESTLSHHESKAVRRPARDSVWHDHAEGRVLPVRAQRGRIPRRDDRDGRRGSRRGDARKSGGRAVGLTVDA